MAAKPLTPCDRFFATRPAYPLRLRMRTPAVHQLSQAPGTTITRVAERADGWPDVTMTFENPSEAATFLLGMAGDAIVVAPDELRDRIRTAADRLALLQAGQTSDRYRPPRGLALIGGRPSLPTQISRIRGGSDLTGHKQSGRPYRRVFARASETSGCSP